MKKTIILMSCILAVITANAQWKSGKGALLGEVSYNFGTGTGLVNGGLKGRYFLKDNMAIRLGLNINTNSIDTTFYENPNGTGNSGTLNFSSSNISINPGIEFHTKGNDKLSPYFGAEIPIMIGSSSEKLTNATFSRYRNDYKQESTVSTTGFGLRLIAGADWYFTEGMYLGFEFGWGYMMSTSGDTETTVSTGGATTTFVDAGANTSTLQATTTGGLRLGVRF